MSVIAKKDSRFRWEIVLNGPETLGDDLGLIGTWVGPRTGPDKRTQGQKEDYALRRLLAAWRVEGAIKWPATVKAETTTDKEPDFTVELPNGRTLGIEVTEAGEEVYQAWLTRISRDADARPHEKGFENVPLEASTERTVDAFVQAIRDKGEKHKKGWYQGPDECDLAVFDNSGWGGFLDKRHIVDGLRTKNDLRGPFRQVHLIFEGLVCVDVFGEYSLVDVRNLYEVDYAAWVFDQVERLRRYRPAGIDWSNIAEELEDLGRSERRALASHLRNVQVHLLKWQYQPERQSESWQHSIANSRNEASELLMENPSFKADLGDVVDRQYVRARRQTAYETGLPLDTFPEESVYSLEQLLDPDFMPDHSGESDDHG